MRGRLFALRRRGARLAAALAVTALSLGRCASGPPPAAAPPPPDAPFAFRDPASFLPGGPPPERDRDRLAEGMEAVRRGDAAGARARFSFGASASGTTLSYRLGVAYADLLAGRFVEGRKALAGILQDAPAWVPASEALADLDAAEGREREALDGYRALRKLLPLDARLAAREEIVTSSLAGKLVSGAEAALEAKDLAAARRDALSLLEVEPGSPAGYRLLARAADAEGRLEDAWTAASKARALDPKDPVLSKEAAELAMKSGHYADAVTLYGDLAKGDPSFGPALDEARFQFQVQTLPEVARRAALSPKVTRAQFAVLAWWLVPEVRDARVDAAPEVAVDAVDRPESQALVRAIALGFFPVARGTHRVGADQAVGRSEAAALLRRVGRLAAGGGPMPGCLAEEGPAGAREEKCGILPESTSRTVTGPEAVRGLTAAALAGRGGHAR